jgi:hypothetical protein
VSLPLLIIGTKCDMLDSTSRSLKFEVYKELIGKICGVDPNLRVIFTSMQCNPALDLTEIDTFIDRCINRNNSELYFYECSLDSNTENSKLKALGEDMRNFFSRISAWFSGLFSSNKKPELII